MFVLNDQTGQISLNLKKQPSKNHPKKEDGVQGKEDGRQSYVRYTTRVQRFLEFYRRLRALPNSASLSVDTSNGNGT